MSTNYNVNLQTKNSKLQSILNTINALPDAGEAGENLDEEITTQTTLLSEQDAKIAELAEVLAGKAAGSGGTSNTIKVTVQNNYGGVVNYWDAEGISKEVNGGTTQTVDVLHGTLYYPSAEVGSICNGDYVIGTLIGAKIIIFLSDGGTLQIYSSSSGAD